MRPNCQILVPRDQVSPLMEAYHDQTGQTSQEQTLSLVRRRLYWPQMKAGVGAYVQACTRCNLQKAKPKQKAPLVPIVPQAPLHIVSMDLLPLSRPTDRYQNLLVITDLFTKFAWAIPITDQTALTMAKALWATVFQPFGCPEVIHSDQDPNFESTLIAELCKMYGCCKTRTTPYHPQGNGGCDRFNQTLLNLLGTLQVDQQNKWVEYLPLLVHSYNNSVHSTTGYVHVCLPLEILWGTIESGGAGSTSKWVIQHHERLQYACGKVSEHLGAAAGRAKRLYDCTARKVPLLPVGEVLVQNYRRQNQGKLSDRWESLPYVVLRHHPDSPVYTVRPEGR